MADDGHAPNGVRSRYTPQGELILCYPDGMEDPTTIFPSVGEQATLDRFMHSTAGMTLIMRLRRREIHDPLTSLLRRDPGREMIAERLTRIAGMPFSGTVSVLVIDLDHFGRINKEYGQSVGDEVLRWAARIFTRHTRGSDVVVRWGGEEFVIFTMAGMPPSSRDQNRDRDPITVAPRTGTTEHDFGAVLNNGKIVAGRIRRQLIAAPCTVGGLSIAQHATFGVATRLFSGEDSDTDGVFDTLFEAADRMLRNAKTTDKRGEIHEAPLHTASGPVSL